MIVILNLDMTVFGKASSVEEALKSIEDNVPQCRKDGGKNQANVIETAANYDIVVLNGVATFMLID